MNKLTAVVLETDKILASGILYPRKVIEKALEDECFKERLDNKCLFVVDGDKAFQHIKEDNDINIHMEDVIGCIDKVDLDDNGNLKVVASVFKDINNACIHCSILGSGDVDPKTNEVENLQIESIGVFKNNYEE